MAIGGGVQHRFAKRVLAVTACAALVVSGGCDDAAIREQRIAKGIEVIPAPPTRSGQPSRTAGSAGPDSPAWTPPPAWEPAPGERPMRFATFRSPGAAASDATEIAVSVFPGRVGGELANINRWRTQMGLAAIEPGELESVIERFQQAGYEGYRARIVGDAGVMLATGLYELGHDRTWFIRAVAAPEAADRIAAEIAAFAASFAPRSDAPLGSTPPASGGEGD